MEKNECRSKRDSNQENVTKKIGGWGGGQFKRWLKQEKASEEVRVRKYSRQMSKNDPNVHT
jgi:hypothetical protein